MNEPRVGCARRPESRTQRGGRVRGKVSVLRPGLLWILGPGWGQGLAPYGMPARYARLRPADVRSAAGVWGDWNKTQQRPGCCATHPGPLCGDRVGPRKPDAEFTPSHCQLHMREAASLQKGGEGRQSRRARARGKMGEGLGAGEREGGPLELSAQAKGIRREYAGASLCVSGQRQIQRLRWLLLRPRETWSTEVTHEWRALSLRGARMPRSLRPGTFTQLSGAPGRRCSPTRVRAALLPDWHAWLQTREPEAGYLLHEVSICRKNEMETHSHTL